MLYAFVDCVCIRIGTKILGFCIIIFIIIIKSALECPSTTGHRAPSMQWEIRRRTRITEIAKGIVELAIKDRKPGPSSGKSIGGDSEYRIYQLLKRYNVKNNQL